MKPHKNGVAIPNQQTAKPAQVTEGATPSYKMPEELHQELLVLNAQVTQMKVALGEKLLELRALEAMTAQASVELNTRITSFARAHGIDPNKPEQGRWNFDIPSGTLTKVG